MHSVGGQRYCSRSLASASRGLPVLGRVQVCSQRRTQTSTLPTPAVPSAGLKQEQRQWSAAVESQLLKWGVEDQTTANDLLVALRAAGLNRPLNFAVATVLSDVIPQLLATAVLGAGAILSFKGGCQAAVALCLHVRHAQNLHQDHAAQLQQPICSCAHCACPHVLVHAQPLRGHSWTSMPACCCVSWAVCWALPQALASFGLSPRWVSSRLQVRLLACKCRDRRCSC